MPHNQIPQLSITLLTTTFGTNPLVFCRPYCFLSTPSPLFDFVSFPGPSVLQWPRCTPLPPALVWNAQVATFFSTNQP